MLSSPDGFTDNSPISSIPYVTVKNISARKSLHQFTQVLDIQNKASVCRLGGYKSKFKATRAGSMLCSSIQNRILHTKSMNGLINLFIILFYNLLRLCSLQSPVIALKYPLIVTLNHR